MNALLDTNIIIHRESRKVVNQDIGILFRWLERANYKKFIHPITVEEIKKNKDVDTVNAFLAKMHSYELIALPSQLHEHVKKVSSIFDVNQNDINDTLLLNEVYVDRIDILVSEDKKIHSKAVALNISERVFTIDKFLEKIFSEHPDLVDYKVLNVQKRQFGNINIKDAFFDSLKEDYDGFERWFVRKTDEYAYITTNRENGLLLSFLYLKVENSNENYADIEPIFKPRKRLKVGTFKVINNGFRLGERFIKIIFDNALINKVDEIYLTIFDHRDEQRRLIELIEQWGFKLWGNKAGEKIYVRDFNPKFDIQNVRHSYPFISANNDIYIVPIYPEYHTELLPDSILNNESPIDFIEDFPHRNAISKVYVSWAIKPHPRPGDILVFYRTGGFYKSVLTTVGIVENVVENFQDEDDFIKQCRKGTVFPEPELRKMWHYKEYKKPFIVRFLYVYSFPNRINLKQMIDLGIIKNIEDAPRGFKSINKNLFKLILHNTKSDESFIVD